MMRYLFFLNSFASIACKKLHQHAHYLAVNPLDTRLLFSHTGSLWHYPEFLLAAGETLENVGTNWLGHSCSHTQPLWFISRDYLELSSCLEAAIYYPVMGLFQCPYCSAVITVFLSVFQWTDGPPPVQIQAQNGPTTSLASLLWGALCLSCHSSWYTITSNRLIHNNLLSDHCSWALRGLEQVTKV